MEKRRERIEAWRAERKKDGPSNGPETKEDKEQEPAVPVSKEL